jgi:fructose-1,6-bisphosphatase/inositol monophosphatase family enzyme
LKSAFPGSVVIGEESTHREPALLQTIADAELAFIVDPIDGTKNFASNLPLFGVMAAVTIRGEIIAGVIHDPVCRDWAYAVRGGGAWAEQEGCNGSSRPDRVDQDGQVRVSQVRIRLTAGGGRIRTCMGLFLSSGCLWLFVGSLFGAGKPFFVL